MDDDFRAQLTRGRRRPIYVLAGVFVLFWGVVLVFGRNKPRCSDLIVCKESGRCSGTTSCYVGSDFDCQRSNECASMGGCKKDGDVCRALSDEDCLPSRVCRESGRCSMKDGSCVVRTDADCRQSALCKTGGACRAKPETPHYGECVVPF